MPKLASAVLLLCFSATALAAQAQHADSTAYTTAAVTLRQQANDHAPSVARLAAQTRVRMAACQNGWCEVGVGGLSGYLPRLALSAKPNGAFGESGNRARSANRPHTNSVADPSADRAAVDAGLERYRQAWLQGDTAMALHELSGDVRFLFPGTPDLDSAAVHALFIDEMAKYRIPTLTLKRAEFFVAGDHAVDIGTYEEVQVPKTGAPIQGTGRYMTVWRREPGGWRIWRFMINELPKS